MFVDYFSYYLVINKAGMYIYTYLVIWLYNQLYVGALERWCVSRGDQPIKIKCVLKVGGANT